MPARHEARERPRQVVRQRLPHERAAAGARLDDPQELERAQRLAHRRARHLELLRELTLRGKLIAGAEVAPLEEPLDLLDDALIEAAAADGLDDGQLWTPHVVVVRIDRLRALVRWSDQMRPE